MFWIFGGYKLMLSDSVYKRIIVSDVNNWCFNTFTYYLLHSLVYHEDWRRMILAQFFHLNDIHLYLNMISLLYHGTPLERKFGTPYFVYMTAVFTVLTGAAYVGLEFVLSELSGNPKHLSTCAVGFSGKANKSVKNCIRIEHFDIRSM